MIEFEFTASIVLYKNDASINLTIDNFLSLNRPSHLYLIDNSPTAELSYLAKNSKVSYIFNNANLGFGAGHNIAIRESISKSKYHLILNPDVEFNPDTIQSLFNFMEINEDVGHVMPKIYYPNGEIQFVCKLLPSPFDLIFKRFLPNKLFQNRFNRYQLKFTGYNQMMDVPYLSGCFMFLRCSSLKEIGLFDERFFMYPEDIDLTRRMHKKFRTVFYPNVSIIHKHEAGSYKSPKLLFIHMVNMIRYFNKWGWVFDKERKLVNRSILKKLEHNSELK
jgi:GT2 family glycosyltransferase